MRRTLHTLLIALALAGGVFVLAPTPEKPSAAELHAECLDWRKDYSAVVPPDFWGTVGDGQATDLSTTSEVDRDAVDEVMGTRPEGCDPPDPPPGVERGEGGWRLGPAERKIPVGSVS